jgi:hypothetical protein
MNLKVFTLVSFLIMTISSSAFAEITAAAIACRDVAQKYYADFAPSRSWANLAVNREWVSGEVELDKAKSPKGGPFKTAGRFYYRQTGENKYMLILKVGSPTGPATASLYDVKGNLISQLRCGYHPF